MGKRNYYLQTYARLRPGLDFAHAAQAIDLISREMARNATPETPRARQGWSTARFFGRWALMMMGPGGSGLRFYSRQ